MDAILKKSLVVFVNGDVIAHHTHNLAIDEYARKNSIIREDAYSNGHVLSMLNLIDHDTANVIVHFGDEDLCKDLLEEIGIEIKEDD